jgi:uncharacterized membrane protein
MNSSLLIKSLFDLVCCFTQTLQLYVLNQNKHKLWRVPAYYYWLFLIYVIIPTLVISLRIYLFNAGFKGENKHSNMQLFVLERYAQSRINLLLNKQSRPQWVLVKEYL